MRFLVDLAEKALIPEKLLRLIFKIVATKEFAKSLNSYDPDSFKTELLNLAQQLGQNKSEAQQFELPFELFEKLASNNLRLSASYWPTGVLSLDEAEIAAMDLLCKHARIEDGMEILEIGCGFGALTFQIAQKFPRCTVIAIAANTTQRDFIENQAQQKKLLNVQVYQARIADLSVGVHFDRVLLQAVFEKIIDYPEVLKKISTWLKPEGRALVEMYCQSVCASWLSSNCWGSWIMQHFLEATFLPSNKIFDVFSEHLKVEHSWFISGRHVQRTAEAWLANLDKYRLQLLPILARTYGAASQELWFQRWRILLLLVSEAFAVRNGEMLQIGHFLMNRRE